MSTINAEVFVRILAELLEEAHVGPPNPKLTWITTNEPDSGFLGTLSHVSAETASRPPAPGMSTIAAHAQHLLFSLSLANRAAKGEDPYTNADWAGSWRVQTVDAAAWDQVRGSLRREHELLVTEIKERPTWDDPIILQGMMALIGHGAYHLGAIRQIRRTLAAAAAA
jgi:hypothetical protein